MISALILFVVIGLSYRWWMKARRSSQSSLLTLQPSHRQRLFMILGGTLAAIGSIPVRLLAEYLFPGDTGLDGAVVTVYLILAAWALLAFFAHRQRLG